MDGMVNNALRAYLINEKGDTAWQELVDQAALETSEFGATMSYDDAVTLSIFGAMV